ncbi:MAG: biopolymer transporter ExbD [Treponema sp.]|jgi:biopolymer transport protein ExbD|nr:biopolymer transporter ExbD [Treponema sp.]
MKIKLRRHAALESSAFSDLAFLLIIYFIVIAGFNINQGFLLDLPKKDSVKTVPKEALLRFRLDAEGVIHFGGRTVSSAEAEDHIQAARGTSPNLAVVLTVAPQSPWQNVVSFVDLAQKSSVESFSFSMEKPVEGEAR